MTRPDDHTDDALLGAFFDVARADRAAPGDALMSRVMADAAAEAGRRGHLAAARQAPAARPGWRAALLAALGGHGAVAGLAAAAVAGLWVGLAPPSALTMLAPDLWGEAEDAADLIPDIDAVLAFASEGRKEKPMPIDAPLAVPPPGPPPGRWMRVLLVVSLALNLAVAGLVAGAMLRGPWSGDGPRAVSVRDPGLGPYAAALSEEDRSVLRRALRARLPDLRAARAGFQADMQAVLGALRAEPFDPEALRAAMDRSSARLTETVAIGQAMVFDRIAALGPAERRAFADRLEAALDRPLRRLRDRDGR
ncbi:MAG TPA: periplasmic heavy metal sensor [Paracoccaceae bacterium]|nr:periplasmic heavy metal sensor [Paracoccaceae bacterium]